MSVWSDLDRKSRPFAHSSGDPSISGTRYISGVQGANIVVAHVDQNYEGLGELDWKNGPDESLGFFICYEDATGRPGNPSGTDYIGFLRGPGTAWSESQFVQLVNYFLGTSYSDGKTAAAGMSFAGYWHNWGRIGFTSDNLDSIRGPAILESPTYTSDIETDLYITTTYYDATFLTVQCVVDKTTYTVCTGGDYVTQTIPVSYSADVRFSVNYVGLQEGTIYCYNNTSGGSEIFRLGYEITFS